ncbi:MAG: PKD domain-containing protein [Bacteroidales bacterium]|nr:PKD domain-containing protein [Bacteroidales bacterium]
MKRLLKTFIFSLFIFSFFQGNAQFKLDSIVKTDVVRCFGDASGTITVYVSEGQTPYEYSIDGGVTYQLSNNFTGLVSGAYSVYSKDFFNQIVSDVVYIDEPVEIQIINETKTDVTGCFGDINGTITINATGGTGALQYSIDNGTTYLNNGGNFTGLSAGTYNIEIIDDSLCVKTGSAIIVGQPAELQITTETVVDVLGCNGADNGSIDILVTGGTSPIQYSIDGGTTFQAGHYFSPLPAGSYSVVVEDANNCTTNGSTLTVNEPAVVSIDSESHTNITGCFGEHTGTITITASGGTGLLYYAIDGGVVFQNNGNFSNLYAGTYNVVVKDENGCSVAGSEIIITEPDEIIIDSESATDITTCFGDATGGITINAHGGSSTLEYSVDLGTTWQASNVFNTLTAGLYTTMVRDAVETTCQVTGQSHTVLQPLELLITEVSTTDVSTCFGGNDGTIHITTNGGGTPAYQFSTDGGATYPHGNDIINLSAGIYDIVVIDSHNCTDTFTTNIVEISEPTPVVITNEVLTDPTCFGGNNGSIEVTASGGTGQLQYSPNGGANFYYGNTLFGLSAGITYDIVVMDDHGCTTIGGSYVLGQPSELIINSIVKQDVSECYGGTNGSIIINAVGGTVPINYSVDNEITYQLSNTFNGLIAGSYHVVVKDNNNCKTDGGTIEILQPEPLLFVSETHEDVTGCRGNNNGAIHITMTGGTPHATNGYKYSINGSVAAYGTGNFINLLAGDYNIIVTDEYDCPVNVNTITINEPEELIPAFVSQQNINCYGDATGNISISASGGQFPYQYSSDNGITYQNNSFFSGLTAGTYQTYVKDAYNCVRIGPEVILTQPDTLEITSVTYTDVIGCNGNNNGTITVSATGGVPGYMYTIDMGSSWYANGGVFTNLSPGDYFVKIYDTNFCEASFVDVNMDIDTIHITEPSKIQLDSINKTDILCYGDNNGTIDIYASGGTGTLSYSIDNGTTYPNTTGNFINLPAANYIVKVVDANNCPTITYPVGIYEPDSLYIENVTAQDESCLWANDGIVTIYATGGSWPYEYSIDGINYQTNRNIENLPPGIYTAVIRDKNMCPATANFTVEVGSPNDASLFTSDVSEGCSPLNVQFQRLNAGTTYLWEFGDGEVSSFNEPSHTFYNISGAPVIYTVTAYSVSPNNCLDTAQMDITVNPQPQLSFTADPMIAYYPETTINITNNSPGMSTYLWNFGDGNTSTDENPGSHTYDDCGEYIISMFAENAYTCQNTFQDTILITAHQPQAFFQVDTTQHCTPFTFYFENQSTFIDTFEWLLHDGTIRYENDFSLFFEEPGTYTIQLNTLGYCNTYDSYDTTITVFQSPEVDFEVIPDTVMLPDQPIRCFNHSSDDSDSFFWEFGDGGTSTDENPIYQYTNEGSYSIKLTVISVNKCTDSLTLLTEVVVLPEGKALFPNAFTPNGDGINDVFKPALYRSVESFKMEIYNRWGELVFYTEDIETGWTGYFDGKLSLQDVYVWRAEGIYLNGTPFIFAGSVTLLR